MNRNMTEETQRRITIKRQTPRKAGRKRGQKAYSQKQRSAALMIVELVDGNVARAAQAAGIERKTLFKWRDELEQEAAEFAQVRTEEGAGDVVAVLKRLVEALCAIVLMKAPDASMRDLYYLMGIIVDKIENLSKLAFLESAPAGLQSLPKVPAQETLPPSGDWALQKAKWEGVVDQVVAIAEAEGNFVSRAEAIAAIIKGNPKAKDYLTEEYSD